jgi:hypothetical protein
MTSIWDDPEVITTGDYIKFEAIGDTANGTITAIRKHTFDDGKVVPQIVLDTADGEKIVTAGQIRLKAELAAKRPGVGDQITITLESVEKRTGGKTLKHFNVIVGPAPVAAPASGLTPEQEAAMAALSPEQRAALSSIGLGK